MLRNDDVFFFDVVVITFGAKNVGHFWILLSLEEIQKMVGAAV